MDANTYATIGDVAKLVGRVGFAVVLIFIIVYMGIQSISNVSASPPETKINAILEPTLEDRTRAILRSDLNEAWNHYESGDCSEDMWKGVHAHIAGKWDEQAKGKGWSEFGWAPTKTDAPAPISTTGCALR